jgi:pyruvate dehydrogenase E1 component beta subunit
MFIEHRWLYDYKDSVPQEPYLIPLGKAVVRRKGKDVTLVASSFMVAIAMEVAKILEGEGIDVEIIDLRTVKPIDDELIYESVEKTGRVAVLDFGYKFCGISAEVSALLAEKAFRSLKSPVLRIALPDVPTPCSHVLEKFFYPNVDKVLRDIRFFLKG